MQKAIKGPHNEATSHGFHVVFTCGEEKEKNLIGVTVPSVRFGRKRLPTLSRAVLAHSGSTFGVEKGSNQSPRVRKRKRISLAT